MIGVVVYVAVDVVLQLLPPHYNPISEAESNLAVGPFGWIMNLNFLGRAVTSFAVAGALLGIARVANRRRVPGLLLPGLALLAVGGICSAVLAFFPTDVAAAGESVVAASVGGTVHLVVATLGFAAALAAIVMLTFWISRSGCLSAARRSALVFTVLAIVGAVFLTLTLTILPSLLGLAERLCLLGILGWTYAVAHGIRRL
jgi:MFS family permease